MEAAAAVGEATERRRRVATSPGLELLERYGLVLLLVAVIAFFTIKEPDTFASVRNWRVIASSVSITSITALALMVPLVAARFDLSIGSIVVVGSIASGAALSRFEFPLVLAVAIALGLAAAVGVVNGALVAYVRVDSLIATLAVTTLLAGVVTWYSEGQSITTGLSQTLLDLGSERLFGLPRLFVVMLVIAIGVWYLLEHTPYGRALAAIGSNEAAARLVGVRVPVAVLVSFVVAGLLGGAAGILNVAKIGTANPEAGGLGLVLPAFAAVFLGATAIHPGRFNVPGTILGIVFVTVCVSGLTLMGVEPWVEEVFNGGALLVAVCLARLIRRQRTGT